MTHIEPTHVLENIFSSIPIEQLKKQIETKVAKLEKFLCDTDIEEDYLYDAVKDCILLSFGGLRGTAYPSRKRLLSEVHHLFRARKIEDLWQPLTEPDFWEPPAQYIGYGRINKPQQQFLYSCDDPFTPFYEARIKDGDYFLLTKYQVVGDLEVVEIGMDASEATAGLSADTEQKLCLIKDCIDKHLLSTHENAYRVSSIIANEVHNFGKDGWCYPSVIRDGGVNFCLTLHAKAQLRVTEAVVGVKMNGEYRYFRALSADATGKLYEFSDWDLEPEQSKAKSICNAILRQEDPSASIALALAKQDHSPTEYPVKIIR